MAIVEKLQKGRLFLYVLLATFLWLSPSSVWAQQAYLRHYGTQEGLPSNNCFYTIQDRKGYIWVGTDAGVSRFDGQVFENYSVDDGLPDNQIIQLNEDRTGRIWFLALNGQLSYFLNGKIFNETNDALLRLLRLNAVVVSFFEDSKGRIWLGTNKNLLVMWDGKSIVKYISANPKRQFINTFVHEDSNGIIWAYSNGCLRRLSKDRFVHVVHETLPLSYKTALNMPDGSLAFIDRTGLKRKTAQSTTMISGLDPSLLQKDPGYFHYDGKNTWIPNSSGIYHVDSTGKSTHYLDQVPSSQVIEDSRHNMWFTTNTGIYMLPRADERLYVFNRASGLSANAVKSITKDDRGDLWIGFDGPVLNVLKPGDKKIEEVSLPGKARLNLIKQLALDRKKKAIYFASDYALGRVNDIYGARTTSLLRESNDALFVLKSFALGKRQELAMALSSGTVVLDDRDHQFYFDTGSFDEGRGFYKNRAYSVFYDSEGELWLSNIGGLSKLSEGQLFNYYKERSILTRRINDIQQLEDGTLVLATDGYGIIYIKDRKIIKVITQRDGLTNNICKKLFVHEGDVWVITNHGINKVRLAGQQAVVRTFEHTSDLLTDGLNGMYIDSQHAYFATNNGLVYFSAKNSSPSYTPKVFITSIVNEKVKLPLQHDNHRIEPENNTLTFYYGAVDFLNKNVTYRYRLRPNAAWTETNNRRLEFSSLEPGEYTFELSARSEEGHWSAATRVNFIMEKHFWQTWWFFMLIVLLAGLAFYRAAVIVTKRQKNKVQEQLLLKNKILMLEQRALQAMMNPHFVFNVMNSIQHYINTKDPASANKVLTGFAKLIRKNLEICTKSYITLAEELEYLNLYLNLEKKRFGEKFSYNITVDEGIDWEETLLPSMILQPFVENAIWHGIMPKADGGNIGIEIGIAGDRLVIRIIDNGIGIDNSLKMKGSQHQSKGMELTKERINLLNEVEAAPIELEIRQLGESGTLVSIAIPLN